MFEIVNLKKGFSAIFKKGDIVLGTISNLKEFDNKIDINLQTLKSGITLAFISINDMIIGSFVNVEQLIIQEY